jgi:HD-GYP domain-containing protein (c-di-GMP phosphodiesterase class II)
MSEDMQVPLFDLIMSLSGVMDLVSPAVANHHKQVAYISCCIAEAVGLPQKDREELVLAAALHDAGAFYLKEKLQLLHFEVQHPHEHAECGYLLLLDMEPLQHMADLVRYHHVPWNNGQGSEFKGGDVPIGSHLIHLADRVAVAINRNYSVLAQVSGICNKVKSMSGSQFNPDLVNAFGEVAVKESFWLDTVTPSLDTILSRKFKLGTVPLHDLCGLTKMISRIIDFRSAFTATHSSGVAATAEITAKIAGFSDIQCQAMRVAGYLHDVGKLAVATEILEKPAQLGADEIHIMRSHTYHTYRTLEPIEELHEINSWASYHHEHLDGSGYPFHLLGDELSTGARIMAVADVFTAITEDRPYRKGMSSDGALMVLQAMADHSKLDSDVVGIVNEYFGEINSIRGVAQAKAVGEHRQFLQRLNASH